MDDKANLSYAALPERLYVVQEGKITYEVSLITGRLFRDDYSILKGRNWAFQLQHRGSGQFSFQNSLIWTFRTRSGRASVWRDKTNNWFCLGWYL